MTLAALQRVVPSDDKRAARDAAHETAAVAAPSVHQSRAVTRPTIPLPRPIRPTHPHKACEERKRAPRGSSCTLLVVGKAASPVADVIHEVLQLRCAVEEVDGENLHDADRSGASHMMNRAAACQPAL